MTEPQRAVVTRLAAEFTALSRQMAELSRDLVELNRVLAQPAPGTPVTPVPFTPPPPLPHFAAPVPPYWPPQPAPAGYAPPPRNPLPRPAPRRTAVLPNQGWIGKVLAVAGVVVTLTGVVLLLVLAAQAGILRPEIRVCTGVLLSAALVTVGLRMHSRPGGRIGAIAVAATGVAAAYMDVIALTTVYHWVSQPVGLGIAALIGGGGLTLARRWDSQHLGLLVLVPLIALAPVLTDGITLLLIGFMLALSAAALPVQIARDWPWMHAARTAAVTLPLLVALAVAHFGSADDPWLLGGACGVAALLAVCGALFLLPWTTNHAAMALITVAGVLPVLCAAVAVNHVPATLMAAALAACLLAIVLAGRRLPGVAGIVSQIFSALSAVSALVAVTVAFQGYVAAPVLLALAVVVAVAGRHDTVARWAAVGFGIVGAGLYLGYAPLSSLVTATRLATPVAASVLAASILLVACACAVTWSWVGSRLDDDAARLIWTGLVSVVVYAVTAFAVTAGVLIGGPDSGFLAGHVAATICWIAMAAALFGYALRLTSRPRRTLPIVGGLALTGAAMAKLFLFDLGTLDGIFRVVVFIVVGLILLGMGAGYARSLAQQDRSHPV